MKIPKISFLFSGGGSQYPGMGRLFFDNYAIFRQTLEEAGDVLKEDLSKICFEEDVIRLSAMNFSQVAIYTVSVGMFRVLTELHNFMPTNMAGHSLGEYAALTCSGALKFNDGLKVVQDRGNLLHEIGIKKDGRMMAINGILTEICEEKISILQENGFDIFISNFNSSEQCILSGTEKSVTYAKYIFEEIGGSVQILPIPTCSHSPLMEEAKELYNLSIQSISVKDPLVPVYSNITGKPHLDGFRIKESLPVHLVQPVQWQRTIADMATCGTDLFLEIGPQTILKNINYYIDDSLATLSFDDTGDRLILESYVNQKIKPFISEFNRYCQAEAVSHPSNFRLGYAYEAQGHIKELIERLSLNTSTNESEFSDHEQVSRSLECLRELFLIKGIDETEAITIVEGLNPFN